MLYYIYFLLLAHYFVSGCDDQATAIELYPKQLPSSVVLRNALENKDISKIKECINAGINPSITLPVGETYSVGFRFKKGIPLLNYAILTEAPDEIIKTLLIKGADANSKGFPRDGFYEATPLIYIAGHWHDIKDEEYKKSVIAALIQYKADVNRANENGNTPLFCAAREGDLSMIKLLLGYKPLIAANKKKKTALAIADENKKWALTHNDVASIKKYSAILEELEQYKKTTA